MYQSHQMRAAPRTVVITGASNGIGRALAIAYAEPGRTLALVGRNEARLAEVAKLCEAKGATVIPAILDVRDATAAERWLKDFDAQHSIDLLIANAGVYTGHGKDELETVEDIAWMMRVNVEGVAHMVQPTIQLMRPRRTGHIAIVGSLAALHPLADSPGYSGSKAGVMAYGEALREYLRDDRITVSLIYPGHVDTAQVADHVGKLPHLWTPEKAASYIKRRLDKRRTTIAFPWQLVWMIKLGRSVDWRVRSFFSRDLRFTVDREKIKRD